MIYIVVEGIVFGLFEATQEIAVDPFDGAEYRVQKYDGKDTISNLSDWKIFDCKNAATALLLAAAGSRHARLRKKISAQMELRNWFVGDKNTNFSVPLSVKNWLNKKIKDPNYCPWDISPIDWLEIYPEAHAIKDTSSHTKLLDLYDQPFGLDWIEHYVS